MVQRILMCLFLLIQTLAVVAQRGGESLYGILDINPSARVAALGGNQVGLAGNDVSMLLNNPAMLSFRLTQQASLSFVPYVADISYGYSGLAWTFEGVGNFAVGCQYVNYGTLVGADESGVKTGSFSAGETVIQLSYSRSLNKRWTGGFSLKPIMSKIEVYNSWGLAADLGVFYRNSDGLLTAGMVWRNFGQQLSAYESESLESLQGDLQIGVSKKLAHAPFRFSLTAQDLLSGSLSYDSTVDDDATSDDDSFGKQVMRHLTLGLEFAPSDNFYVAGGVNPRRRQELAIESLTSTVGYSWGFGLRISKFNFSYGSSRYHLAGSSNYFSITTNLSSF
jgi:hypothetical protein